MRPWWVLVGVLGVVLATACGGDDMALGPDAGVDAMAIGDPTAADLLAAISNCAVIGGKYANGPGLPANVDICGGVPGAVFWKSDLDVDCDGKMTLQCNAMTDPAYQSQTAATDSHGDPLDAAALPYVVIPGASAKFNYRNNGLAMGSVVAVIYGDRVEYGVLGDVGPTAYIGEASYRMAALLGINPDPRTGGADGGVAYIAFAGTDARVMVMEDHDEAVRIGIVRARALTSSP